MIYIPEEWMKDKRMNKKFMKYLMNIFILFES